MQGKIVFEEHMAIPETLGNTKAFAGDSGKWEEFERQILDMGSERLELMDKNGIEFAILSNNAPGVQAILDTNEAIEVAKKANDAMAEAVQKNPKRYGAFAALPMQDPDAASEELIRCVKDLGFYGSMVNGFTQKGEPDMAIYYDIPEYKSFWATVSELDVPFYLHPRMQLEANAPFYDGHPWLKSSPWGFAVETSIHALRMCGSAMFDDHPNLKIIIGHLGEHIPYDLWRIDARMKFSRRAYRGKNLLGENFLNNFLLTTSGNFSDPAFRCCLEVVGIDRMFFSADYPFETMEDACDWFDATDVINDEQRLQIGRTNAINYFKLDLD
ncbi:MAG: amidohydrolase family protein [Rhodospirillales bacterium]|jgi:2,3-dihydroxybenzoate decarboxylase